MQSRMLRVRIGVLCERWGRARRVRRSPRLRTLAVCELGLVYLVSRMPAAGLNGGLVCILVLSLMRVLH